MGIDLNFQSCEFAGYQLVLKKKSEKTRPSGAYRTGLVTVFVVCRHSGAAFLLWCNQDLDWVDSVDCRPLLETDYPEFWGHYIFMLKRTRNFFA